MERKGTFNKRSIEMALIGVLLLLSALPISVANQPQPSDPINVDAWQNANLGNGFGSGPAKATLYSPNSIIDTGTPTYKWSAEKGTEFYCLKVNDSSGNTVVNQCYKAVDLGAAVPLRVTPSVVLGPGDYKWRIQTWNCTGSNWSNELLFTVCTSTSYPRGTILISPKGTVGTTKPTYVWNTVSGATRYHLKVINTGTSTAVIDQWNTSTDVVSGSTCSIKPDVALVAGSYYKWWVQTGNCRGDGPWSSYLSFKVTSTPPGKVSPISPRGLISTRTPAFTWTAVPTATEYLLRIENETDIIFEESYLAEDVTVGSRCRVDSPMILPLDDSDFFWRVQASNDAGPGLMSNYLWFEPVCSGVSKKDPAKAKRAHKSAID